MNKCPNCGKVLVTCDTLHAFDGKLYCSRICCISDKANKLYRQGDYEDYREAIDAVINSYDNTAEVVRMEDVLGEDLQEVHVAVTFFKTIKVPKSLPRDKALEVTEHMWNTGKLLVEPGHCDDVRFECELVDSNNSAHEEADTNG